jgi:hypothetical protein
MELQVRQLPRDYTDLYNSVAEQRIEAAQYLRQWILWLGVGSAGAAATFLTLAANACDPDTAIKQLAPSIWSFLVGIISATSSLLIASFRSSAAASRYSASIKLELARDEIREIRKGEADSEDGDEHRLHSYRNYVMRQWQRARSLRVFWNICIAMLLIVSAGSFVYGTARALQIVSSGQHLLGTCKHTRG